MDAFYKFLFFACATIFHLIVGVISNNEIKKIEGGYVVVMVRLFRNRGFLPKVTSISFFILLFSILLLLTING